MPLSKKNLEALKTANNSDDDADAKQKEEAKRAKILSSTGVSGGGGGGGGGAQASAMSQTDAQKAAVEVTSLIGTQPEQLNFFVQELSARCIQSGDKQAENAFLAAAFKSFLTEEARERFLPKSKAPMELLSAAEAPMEVLTMNYESEDESHLFAPQQQLEELDVASD